MLVRSSSTQAFLRRFAPTPVPKDDKNKGKKEDKPKAAAKPTKPTKADVAAMRAKEDELVSDRRTHRADARSARAGVRLRRPELRLDDTSDRLESDAIGDRWSPLNGFDGGFGEAGGDESARDGLDRDAMDEDARYPDSDTGEPVKRKLNLRFEVPSDPEGDDDDKSHRGWGDWDDLFDSGAVDNTEALLTSDDETPLPKAPPTSDDEVPASDNEAPAHHDSIPASDDDLTDDGFDDLADNDFDNEVLNADDDEYEPILLSSMDEHDLAESQDLLGKVCMSCPTTSLRYINRVFFLIDGVYRLETSLFNRGPENLPGGMCPRKTSLCPT